MSIFRRCRYCGYKPRFYLHKHGKRVALLGRLVRYPEGLAFVCRVCLGNLKPSVRQSLLKRAA